MLNTTFKCTLHSTIGPQEQTATAVGYKIGCMQYLVWSQFYYSIIWNVTNNLVRTHKREEEQSLKLALGQPRVWSDSGFIFLASAYKGAWSIFILVVSSSQWQCTVSVLIVSWIGGASGAEGILLLPRSQWNTDILLLFTWLITVYFQLPLQWKIIVFIKHHMGKKTINVWCPASIALKNDSSIYFDTESGFSLGPGKHKKAEQKSQICPDFNPEPLDGQEHVH